MTATPEDLRLAAEAQYAKIRSNSTLTAEAKRQAIAKAYLSTKAALDQMKADVEAAANGRQEALAKQLYGIPGSGDASTLIAYRDAADRADKIEDESQAIALLNKAQIVGDDLQVRALLSAGYSNYWAGVINAYIERNPTKEAAAEELWDLVQPGSGKPQGPFMGFLNYLAVAPAELTGCSEWKIQEIAAGQPNASELFA